DALGRTRPSLLLEARAGARAWPKHRGGRVTPALVGADGGAWTPPPVAPVAVPERPEFSALDRTRHECASTGLWFSGHPLDELPPAVERAATTAAALDRCGGRRVTVIGLPCAYRRVETRTGEPMLFLTLADRTGLIECALFPDQYKRWAPSLHASIMRVTG